MAKISAPNDGKIEKRVWIKASPEVIYKALTDARDLVRWFCDRASCDPREGGELVACWKTGKTVQKGRAIFTRIIPYSALELLWVDDGQGVNCESAGHTLCYIIQSRAGTTELIVHDSDDPLSDEETFTILDQGWNGVLLELKDYCERRERSLKLRSQKMIVE